MPGKTARFLLGLFFTVFTLFLYGPTFTIIILSFQGPNGGLTFPMNGVSTEWFGRLFEQQAVGDFGGSVSRSLALAVMVTIVTVVVSLAAGMAFRRRFAGSAVLFYMTVASLIVPSLLIGLGIGLVYTLMGWEPFWYTSAFGAHLTWTLPFGLLIMLAVFNRFDKSWEEAGRDLGATPWQGFWHIVLPIIAPSVIGIAMFAFTLSFDEFARTRMTAGTDNTLPLEILGMTTTVTTPVLYALGTTSTALSFLVIAVCFVVVGVLRKRRGLKVATQ